MKHVFIVNPVSGKGSALLYIPFIKEYFLDKEEEFEIVQTEYRGHATEIANRYHKEDNVCLYTVGGDGTMNEVLNGVNEGVTLCVIPGGTGNDFYKTINKGKFDHKDVLVRSIEGDVVEADYGVLNGNYRFLNVLSFGLDADINVYANDVLKIKYNLPGSLVYAIAALKVGLKPQTYHFEMEIDGRKCEDDTVLVAICNGKYYGGCFLPAPKADITDGIFDSCYFKGPLKSTQVLKIITKYVNGKHYDLPLCVPSTGSNYHIKFDREVAYQIDGENLRLTEATIEMHRGGLKLKMPKNN